MQLSLNHPKETPLSNLEIFGDQLRSADKVRSIYLLLIFR
jgi:hypothetical protein